MAPPETETRNTTESTLDAVQNKPTVATHAGSTLEIFSDNLTREEGFLYSQYSYPFVDVWTNADGSVGARPSTKDYVFRTETKVPKVGVMLVGWGGNNGSTFTASLIANRDKVSWEDETGIRQPNYFGSITQASTTRVGIDKNGKEIFVPLNSLLPAMVKPNDLIVSGWDINDVKLGDAMKRARVLPFDLQRNIFEKMQKFSPLPGIFDPIFIAGNQADRANNVIKGTKSEAVERVRADIREFKAANNLESVVILWTANTERFALLKAGVNDTAENLLAAIERNEEEIAPSSLYAVASILEGCAYINGSPQNTFVPGLIELAVQKKVHIGGDDFKSGQTKFKSAIVDFLVSAGIKPMAISSYNHLGNNDGLNLSAPAQFRSKEISKSDVVTDMVESNPILYNAGERPDHTVVIKYVPYVGDSKRAMDEYVSEILLHGQNTIVVHNTCEDSLLAVPLMFDLVVLTELFDRITFKAPGSTDFEPFHTVLSVLSYLLKAPKVPAGTPVINSLYRQKSCIENILRACAGLPAESNMMLECMAPERKPIAK